MIKTFVKEPPRGYSVTTTPITEIPFGGIKPAMICRISRDDDTTKGKSLTEQTVMGSGHLFKHKDIEQTTIPEGGIPCFSEANSAWSDCCQALLHLLNDPILSRLDADGQCIAFNSVVFCYVDRVSRCLADFDVIEAAFVKEE